MSQLFGLSVYTQISRRSSIAMSLTLFVILVAGYFSISYMRHVDSPNDKVVPSLSQLARGIEQVISVDQNGSRPIVRDTVASLRRFSIGVITGSIIGFLFGMNVGLFPLLESFSLRFMLYFGKVPTLSILPIIFIIFGLDETTKVVLIILGITPAIALDTYFRVKGLPKEHLVKALTLGASIPEVVHNVVRPQIMPAALNAVRLNLLSAWLFLIAGEAIAADSGLGYRIFVVRRYMAMDTIIPYVLWIALLSFLLDAGLAWWIRRRYPWYEA